MSQRLVTRRESEEHEALSRLEPATCVKSKVVSQPGHFLAQSIKDLGRAPSNPPRGWQTARKVGNMPERFLDSHVILTSCRLRCQERNGKAKCHRQQISRLCIHHRCLAERGNRPRNLHSGIMAPASTVPVRQRDMVSRLRCQHP